MLWVLLLGLLSSIGLCLGRLSLDEIFLLHVGGVVVGVGESILAAASHCAIDWCCSCGQTWWKKGDWALVLLAFRCCAVNAFGRLPAIVHDGMADDRLFWSRGSSI